MRMIINLVEKAKKSPLVLLLWYLNGKKLPPPHIYKQKVVSSYGKNFGINNFYESGTFKGDMVHGMKDKFKKITTIELSDLYFRKAKERFKKNKHIEIIKGDSEKEIKKFLKKIKSSCIFWLDGHYSYGNTAKGKLNTPIISELKTILDHKTKSHVILIDDARCFTGKDDYPTIHQLQKSLKNSNYLLERENDIIRIVPRNQ